MSGMRAPHASDTLDSEKRPSPPTMVEDAILATVAYVDVFDYPRTAAEIHRYLVGLAAAPTAVDNALESDRLLPHHLQQHNGFYHLPGRAVTVAQRSRRAAIAQTLWPIAHGYGRTIARLPFVRMVAVTGSLAVDNPKDNADIDYLIVTENGRLWLCRAFVIAVVRLAARRGITLCPNYFISENALAFSTQNLYTAHELVQMVPLAGTAVYHRLRAANAWTARFLPNAAGPPRPLPDAVPNATATRRLAERLLRTSPGARLEQWEMSRKIRKFTASQRDGSEVDFSADWCKGHFENHMQRTIRAYAQRLERVHPGNGRFPTADPDPASSPR